MASIFKKGRDKGKKRACWQIGYTDENGKRRTEKGFTDKGMTEQRASKIENEVMLRKRGLIDPQQEKTALQKRMPVIEQLSTFQKHLGKNTEKHIKLTLSRVRKIVDGCGFQTIGEINSEEVQGFLVEFQAEEDFGNRTFNHYVQAIDSFCNWLVSTKRLNSNPILGLERMNADVDVRHQRRALSPNEFAKLVQSAILSDKEIQCYDGETRAKIYILSYMTGLRRKELASLTPQSFNLKCAPPTVTIEAARSKHRRKDVLPLHPALVVMLRAWLAGLGPDEPLFPKLAKRRTWLMVKKDLGRAGIPYKTHEGIADFHAAGRHTHITELLRNGASLPEAMGLARHSDVKTTMKYAHIGIQDQARALTTGLPVPQPMAKRTAGAADDNSPFDQSWQRIGSAPGVVDGRLVSPDGTTVPEEGEPKKRQNPCEGKGFDADCQELSPDDSDDSEWRRRGLNPRPVSL